MNYIYRGEPILKEEFILRLKELNQKIEADLLLDPPSPDVVIEAVHSLVSQISKEEILKLLTLQGIPLGAAEEFVRATVDSLNRDALYRKVKKELGENPFIWKLVDGGIEEKEQPLGVILHIGAGNTLGLSAYSVIEGLLTGNINILKLPEQDGGISARLLLALAQIEPRIKPYLYVLDISSKEREIISQLLQVANGVAVWGSDEAIDGIRKLAPPSLPIIEWGQRLSFAYFTHQEGVEKDLKALAKEVCLTDQLYCSSPQCVFYETDNPKELEEFAGKLAKHMEAMNTTFPAAVRETGVQSQITLTHQLVKMEEILEEKKLLIDDQGSFGIMIDYHAVLKPSPLYRNIWVMPVRREQLMGLLRPHKGYLQTVGLSCHFEEYDQLSTIFYAAGVNRIKACGEMAINYPGEAHDGMYPLKRYTRLVNRRIKP